MKYSCLLVPNALGAMSLNKCLGKCLQNWFKEGKKTVVPFSGRQDKLGGGGQPWNLKTDCSENIK